MKYLFIVQGEGRGHLTQAISLKQMLEKAGHEVAEVLLAKSPQRQIPQFFYDKVQTHVTHFDEPNFIRDKNNKGIKTFKTLIYNIKRIRKYKNSVKTIDKRVLFSNADAIVNFYSFAGGLYNLNPTKRLPFFCIGHQYLFLHEKYNIKVKNNYWKRVSLNIATRFTSIKATKKIALSFYKLENDLVNEVFVAPPLLREEVKNSISKEKDYFLCYILNDGYRNDIEKWHNNYKNLTIHMFGDGNFDNDEIEIHKNLFWHKINDEKFIKYLSECKGFASTAGFESICEAMFLQKPVLLVPTQNHIEQQFNAIDAVKAGAGINDKNFNIQRLVDYADKHNFNKENRDWLSSNSDMILNLLSLQ